MKALEKEFTVSPTTASALPTLITEKTIVLGEIKMQLEAMQARSLGRVLLANNKTAAEQMVHVPTPNIV